MSETSTIRCFAALLCLLLAVGAPLPLAADVGAESIKNVLVLYSFSDPGLFDSLDHLKTAVRTHTHARVNFYVEYMETQRFADPGYEISLSKTLHYAYRGKHLDLVIVAAYPALRFLMTYGSQIAPGVPIVFSYIFPLRIRDNKLPSNITGVTVTVDIRGSLDLVFRLQPDTHNVALIVGDTEFDRYGRKVFHDEFRPYEGKAKLIDLAGLPAGQLLRQVSVLPQNTVVFFQSMPQMSKQPVLGTYDVLARIARQLPTYCIYQNYCIGRGGIGGSLADYSEQTEKTGELAGQILSGAKPESVPVAHDSGARVYVDWRQLHRWNIPASALPPGSVVLHRQPTVWELYERPIIIGITVVALQALLIVGLLRQRSRKQKIEIDFRESEERFRLIAGTAPAMIWMSDKSGKCTFISDKWCELTGSERSAGLGDGFTAYIHPDDVQAVKRAVSWSQDDASILQVPDRSEFRLRTRGGVYRWMLSVVVPRFLDGSFAGFIGSAIDITEQRVAQEELAKLGGRLIEAQEMERTRIARELHDDICQRLVLLSIKLDRALTNPESSPTGIDRWPPEHERLQQIQQASRDCSEITRSVQALSHELHSSNLDYVGLVGAARSFCQEFSEQHRVAVELTTATVPDILSREVSLCVFRVLQEALRNAARHSGVSHFEVSLRGTANEVELQVRDAGIGFDPQNIKEKGGLGLVSIRERVQLVRGTTSIETRVNGGTTVRIRVPVVADVAAIA